MEKPNVKKNGFTLIEIIVVLGVLGVMLGILIPRVDIAKSRVDATIQSATLTLNAAQRKAALRQHDVVVALDASGMRMRIHSDVNNDAVIDAGEQIRYLEFEEEVALGRAGAPANPVVGSAAIEFEDTQDGLPSVTFHRNGSASSFAGFYISSRRPGKEYARALAILRATGEVRCYSYSSGTWEVRC